MGFSSQAGRVIFRSQTVAGTYNADTATAGVAAHLRGGSLGPTRELMVPDPEIGGGRDVVDSYLGAGGFSGDYEFYARTDMLLTLLKAVLGTEGAPVTTTGVTTHTFTPLDSGTLPFLSISERLSSSLENYAYNDCVVNTLHLEAEANGYLMGTAGVIGAKQVIDATPAAAGTETYDESPMYVGTNITITYNAVSLPAMNFSLDINNNFEDDNFRLGSFYLNDLTAKRREITASFGIRPQDSSLWRQAVYGVPTATQMGGVTTKNQLVITCSTYEFIPGGTPNTVYSLVFTVPKFIFRPFAFGPSGDDVIESDLEGQAVRPVFATPIMTTVAKTGMATTK
jgi:hypothetical protein